MTLAEKIQEMRKANNLTQEQLAEMLNVSRQAVSKWESEQSMPEIDKIVQMSEIFNTTTDCLLKNNPTKQQQAGRNDDAGNAKAALNTKQLSIISYAVFCLKKKIAYALWYNWQTPMCLVAGIIIQIAASAFFTVKVYGFNLPDSEKRTILLRFYIKGLIFLLPLPAILIYDKLLFIFVSHIISLLKD